MTPEEGLIILADTVKNGQTHRDYKRVTELAKKYHQLITGDGIEGLMRQFSRREDATLFQQRKDITQHICPSVASSIMSPFYKVGRVNPIKRSIEFENTESFDDKKKDLEAAIDKFYGDKSLDKYLETRFVELSFSDPNAFIVTEFDEPERDAQGNPTEKVRPYPWEVSSEQAVNFKYKNNVLQWLVVKHEWGMKQTYIEGEGNDRTTKIVDEAAANYTIYLKDNAIKFTQVPFHELAVPEDGRVYTYQFDIDGIVVERQYIRFDQRRVYQVEYFTYKTGRVPAIRVGYKHDLITKGRTYVSPMESGVPYFMKMIKTVSEFDLTMCLHVFPQKMQYVPRCVGESKEISCDGGKAPDGTTCKVCHGSGQMPAHTSAQDAFFIRMPKDPKDMIDLEKLMVYKNPDIELVKFQREYISDLAMSAQKAVFNSDIFNRPAGDSTATKELILLDNVYDTLFPFSQKYSEVWIYQAATVAALRDHDDAVVDHRFPKDFKFKSVGELLLDLKLANDSSAPAYVKQEINRDIAYQQFMDKPEELQRIYVKEKFFPFAGKSTTEIIYIISNGKTTQYNEVLWSNFEQVFLELEMEAEEKKLYFYDYPFKEQKRQIDTKVQALITQINSEVPGGAIPLPDGGGA